MLGKLFVWNYINLDMDDSTDDKWRSLLKLSTKQKMSQKKIFLWKTYQIYYLYFLKFKSIINNI